MLEEEMKKIEAFFGKPFKEKPRVLPWSAQNVWRAFDGLNRRYTKKDALSRTGVQKKYLSNEPFVCVEINTIVIQDDAPQRQKLHELAHLYVHQHWPLFNDHHSLFFMVDEKSAEDAQQWFAQKALNEGIAEYVSLELQPDAQREELLQQLFTETVNMSSYWDDFAQIQDETTHWSGIDKRRNFAYALGYAFIKNACKGKEARKEISRFIEENPSIVEMAALIERANK